MNVLSPVLQFNYGYRCYFDTKLIIHSSEVMELFVSNHLITWMRTLNDYFQ